jgi:hypothetical protein
LLRCTLQGLPAGGLQLLVNQGRNAALVAVIPACRIRLALHSIRRATRGAVVVALHQDQQGREAPLSHVGRTWNADMAPGMPVLDDVAHAADAQR